MSGSVAEKSERERKQTLEPTRERKKEGEREEEDGWKEKEKEGRTKKAENSASSLYNCLNATGIAFIQLKHSLSPYIRGGEHAREGGGGGRRGEVVGLGGVGGREIRWCPPSLCNTQR